MGSGLKLWTWDLEAFEWDHVVCAVLSSEDGDVVRITGNPGHILESVANHMRRAPGTYVAHYGGGYDVPLLLNAYKFAKIVLSGSNILCAEESRRLKLRDSYPWFLASLAKVGDAVGEKKKDVDRANLRLLPLDEIVDYCESDTRILMKGVQAAQKFLDERGADRAWTAGASAVSLLRALEPGSWSALRRHALTVDDLRASLQIVRGGRVECWARGRVENVYAYDIKSSYPARYANTPVGIGIREATDNDTVGVWRCRWVWKDRRRIPPALDDLTMSGVGLCEAWLISEEIEAFERMGVKVEKLEGVAPQTMLDLGQTFVREMWKAKEGDGPTRFCGKVWLNSLHGKACEDPVKESFTRYRPSKTFLDMEPELAGSYWRYFECNVGPGDSGIARPYAQPIWGAQTLGRARVALWDTGFRPLQDAGWNVYYGDTDSCLTNCPPEKFPSALGTNLGQWNAEGGPYTGYFLGPKSYLLVDSAGKIVKHALKGIPLRAYEYGIEDVTSDGKIVFREARRPSPKEPEGEKGSDVRVKVFERTLSEGVATCTKDGITSFLRGLKGVTDEKTGVKDAECWKRAPFLRDVHPSGRGKLFSSEVSPTAWAYLSSLEIAALSVARALVRPHHDAWMQHRDGSVKRFLMDKRFMELMPVGVYANHWTLTLLGRLWLKKMGGGDNPPPIDDPDERDYFD